MSERHTTESAAGIEHGTLTAYTKRGCRCDPCREFWNAYMRWWRADQRGRLHGACPTCKCPLPHKPGPVTPPAEPCATCGWAGGHDPRSISCHIPPGQTTEDES